MKLLDWVLLSALISLSVGSSSFLKLLSPKPTLDLCTSRATSDYRRHDEVVCGKKIKLKHARVSDFALIDGISIKKARVLAKAVKEHPQVVMNDLLEVKGIGPKTLVKLEDYFEP